MHELQARLGAAPEVHWFGDSYHMLTLDNEREVVARRVCDFLSRHLPVASSPLECSMTTTTLERLCAIAERELAVESLADKLDTPFAELGIDSLGLVDFMFTVEDELHVSIEHDRAMRTPTLAGLASLVDELLAPRRSADRSRGLTPATKNPHAHPDHRRGRGSARWAWRRGPGEAPGGRPVGRGRAPGQR